MIKKLVMIIYVEGDVDTMWNDYGINTDYTTSHQIYGMMQTL